jgi:hypothetical protein
MPTPIVNEELIVSMAKAGAAVSRIAARCRLAPSVVKKTIIKNGIKPPRQKPYKKYRYQEVRKTLLAWASDPVCQVHYQTLLNRIKSGWRIGKALTTPAYGRKK